MDEVKLTTKDLAKLLQKSTVRTISYVKKACPEKWISKGTLTYYNYNEVVSIIKYASNWLKPEIIFALEQAGFYKEKQ